MDAADLGFAYANNRLVSRLHLVKIEPWNRVALCGVYCGETFETQPGAMHAVICQKCRRLAGVPLDEIGLSNELVAELQPRDEAPPTPTN